MVAAAYASGASPDEIEFVARTMKFKDVARWTLSRYGLAGSERMSVFLSRLLKKTRFEDMRIPLTVVASDLKSGHPVIFRDHGDVVIPIRASCSYPGLFTPIRDGERCLVDGMVSMEVPAKPVRDLGATHVISVVLPNADSFSAGNMFSVVNRCFQVMSNRMQGDWRRHSSLVISPPVAHIGWDGFVSSKDLIQAGERAAKAAIPSIRRWMEGAEPQAECAVTPIRRSEQACLG
jgi:NTE family protein